MDTSVNEPTFEFEHFIPWTASILSTMLGSFPPFIAAAGAIIPKSAKAAMTAPARLPFIISEIDIISRNRLMPDVVYKYNSLIALKMGVCLVFKFLGVLECDIS